MGLFSFLADAGKKIFSSDVKQDDSAKRDKIHSEIEALNLPAHLSVDVQGETVKISGNAQTEADKEKIILAVGNLEGVSSVDENITVAHAAAPEAKAVFHTVAKGETLSKIAEKYYHNAAAYKKIFEANRPMLKSEDEIYPGQVLRIENAVAVA